MKKVKKQHLPEKVCVVCQRPFTWRKKWEKNWEEVKYCSEKCKRTKSYTKIKLILDQDFQDLQDCFFLHSE